jgi:hypothetical protein
MPLVPCRWLDEHYAEPVQIEQLADSVNIRRLCQL